MLKVWNVYAKRSIFRKEFNYLKFYSYNNYYLFKPNRYISSIGKFAPKNTLFKLLIAESRTVAPAVVSVLFSSGILLLFPRALGNLLNELSGINLTRCVFLVSLAATASLLKTFSSTLAAERIATRLRIATFGSLLQKDAVFFDKTHSSNLATLLSNDITVVSSIIYHLCTAIRMSITSVMGAGLALYFAPPSLFAFILAPALLALCLVVTYGRYAKRLNLNKSERLGRVIQYAQERLSAIRIVKAFNAQKFEEDQFKNKLSDIYALSRKAALAAGLNDALCVTFVGLSILLISHLSASTVAEGILDVGDVSSLLLYTAMSGGGAQGFVTSMNNIQNCLGSAQRVFEHIECVKGNNMPIPHITVPSGILFDNVTFAYPTRPAKHVLKNLTLNVPSGSKVAIIGESGSGKSTIVQLLMKLYKPISGNIYIDGKSIEDFPDELLRSHITWVSQEYPIFSNTVRDNVIYPSDEHNEDELERAYQLSKLSGFVYNLPGKDLTFVGEGGRSLSGGERQRIHLARLFLKSKNILLLDEPTASLDSQLELEIVKSMKMIKNRTVIIITHRNALLDAVDFTFDINSQN